MPAEDERVITLGVAEWNVVLSALQLAGAIIGKISSQAAAQERPRALPNGPDLDPLAPAQAGGGVTAD